MERPNWFDNKFGKSMERASAEECLEMVSKDPRVVKAVRDALASHDADSKKPGLMSRTRSQAVRNSIAEVLQAET
jgi:hypothetical protein